MSVEPKTNVRDGDLYPPEAPNAMYWNHHHRTYEKSEHWALWRGDVLLGTFTLASLPWGDMAWLGFAFKPEPAFEEIRPLFDEELRLLNEEWGIRDLSAEHNAVWEQIEQIGLTLVEEHGWVISDFMLHVDRENNAWFRIAP
jgi:hypothetical protein